MATPLRIALLLFFSVAVAVAGAEDGCQAEDLKRAKQRVPRAAWKGSSFAGMAKLLSQHLSKSGHTVRACAEWTIGELQQLQRRFFDEAEPELLSIYDAVVDNRRQRFKTLSALEAHWAKIDVAAAGVEGLDVVRRDGLCHETVMSAVHHISAKSLRRILEDRQALPSLPVHRHEFRSDPTELLSPTAKARRAVHNEYEHQVSCQQCHTGIIVDPVWQDATLPKPVYHADTELERLERLRTCDYQARPPCGPCEGLGGKRWGEGLHEFSPIPCTVIHGSEEPPTTKGRYPELGSASFTGETRSPLEIRPKAGEHVKYFKMNGNISVDYRGTIMFRQRYDFGEMGAEVSVQTYEQAKNMDPGATIGAGGPACECRASIAGLFHRNCFDASDPLNPLKLAPQEGGADYLGRIKIKLDGDSQAASGEFIADHYMKWAFHFLVDANENSSSFGLPLRLYGPMGVRQVFENWNLEDPAKARPDIWHLPRGCNVSTPACSLFPPARQEEIVV